MDPVHAREISGVISMPGPQSEEGRDISGHEAALYFFACLEDINALAPGFLVYDRADKFLHLTPKKIPNLDAAHEINEMINTLEKTIPRRTLGRWIHSWYSDDAKQRIINELETIRCIVAERTTMLLAEAAKAGNACLQEGKTLATDPSLALRRQ